MNVIEKHIAGGKHAKFIYKFISGGCGIHFKCVSLTKLIVLIKMSIVEKTLFGLDHKNVKLSIVEMDWITRK